MEDSRSFREYFLVNIPTAMYLTEDNEIENYLKANKFKCDAPFRGRPWYFVNILNKTYKPGRPAAAYGKVIGDTAITLDEFKIIYEIYKKHNEVKTPRKKKCATK